MFDIHDYLQEPALSSTNLLSSISLHDSIQWRLVVKKKKKIALILFLQFQEQFRCKQLGIEKMTPFVFWRSANVPKCQSVNAEMKLLPFVAYDGMDPCGLYIMHKW